MDSAEWDMNYCQKRICLLLPFRIEFFNPGTLPDGVSLQEILTGKCASNPRNKQIASIFKEAGLIEKYGSGIKRIRQAMLSAGAREPVFEIIGNFFKVTLFPITGGVNGGVNLVYDYIKENPGKKTNEIRDALNIPQRTLERLLKRLRDENKIEFRGEQ